MPRNLPFMKFYVADYLGDTRDLSCEEHGAYLLLLFHYWQTGQPLLKNERYLGRLTSLNPARFARVWRSIGRFFYEDGNFLRNKRLDYEIDLANQRSLKASEAGRRSAEVRWSGNDRVTDVTPELQVRGNGRYDSVTVELPETSNSGVTTMRGKNKRSKREEEELREREIVVVVPPPPISDDDDDDDDDDDENPVRIYERETGRTATRKDLAVAAEIRDCPPAAILAGIRYSVERARGNGDTVSSLRYCVPAVRRFAKEAAHAAVGAKVEPPKVEPEPERPALELVPEPVRRGRFSDEEKNPLFQAAQTFIRRKAALGENVDRDEIRAYLIDWAVATDRPIDLVDEVYPAKVG